MCATVILLAVGTVMALSVYEGYQKGQQKYMNLQGKYTQRESDNEYGQDNGIGHAAAHKAAEQKSTEVLLNLPRDSPERISIDWQGLKEVNEDIIAWIQLPAVGISYPVVQADNNDYYLHRSVDKEYLYAGSIFIDYLNSPRFDNFNTVMYGHNMRDGSMFAKLKEYNDEETYLTCPYFWLYTPEGDYLYKIFSIYTAAAKSDSYIVRFSSNQNFLDWLQDMKEKSVISTETDISQGDKIVTLSTCTGNSTERQIVQGIRIWKP